MSLRLLACLACSAALLLGACSGSNTPGPSNADGDGNNGSNGGGGSNGEDGDDGSDGDMVQTPLDKANDDYKLADEAVRAADAAIEAGNQERALELIAAANRRLTAAVASARAAVEAARSGTAAALGAAQRALERALRYQRTQAERLQDEQESFAWYRTRLVRYTFANGVAVTPQNGTNEATIKRIEQTKDTSETDNTQIVNPDAFTASTFELVPYADGKRAFNLSDDEFKVDGYTAELSSYRALQPDHWTGLKLTSGGLVIRTGGTSSAECRKLSSAACNVPDFTDMRRDITKAAGDTNDSEEVDAADGLRGQNGWDLKITFDAPQTVTVRGGDSSWNGNADFYWKSIVRAADSQLRTHGKYYQADAFNDLPPPVGPVRPDNLKYLGTYEVWLSNHIGVERNQEPTSGSGTYPEDDDNFYLKYAAYGLFIYTADTETYWMNHGSSLTPVRSGQNGRMQSIHYGYSAFADVSGQRTTDIGEAITNGRFRGQTLAYAVRGYSGNGKVPETRLLRGDASLTVTIPKTTGTGAISGTLNNFEEWEDGAWERCDQNRCLRRGNNFAVLLASTTISNVGEFSGSTSVTGGRTDLNGEAGSFKGAVYGPRGDSSDLEVAGSWTIGFNISSGDAVAREAQWSIMGSFGAKQRQAGEPGS